MISASHVTLGSSGRCSREYFKMIDAIWCALMHILIKFCLKKVLLFNIKIITFKKKCCKLLRFGSLLLCFA